jgi:hypothetical protein
MAMANALSYYNMATITIVKCFMVQNLGVLEVNGCGKHSSLLQYSNNYNC